MSIISILRDTPNNVSIVRIISSDTLATVASADYIADNMDDIRALNAGFWQWFATDFILVAASDGNGIFTFTDSTFSSLMLYGTPGGGVDPGVANDFAIYAVSGSTVSGITPTAARTLLGLGSMALQAASAVAITGGTGVFTDLTMPYTYVNLTGPANLSPNASNSIYVYSNPTTLSDALGLASFENGYSFALKNISGSTATFTPKAGDTIDGNASLSIANQQAFIVVKSPTQWNTVAVNDIGIISTIPLTSGHIFVGNASNIATDTALSGDGSITNAGVLTISSIGGMAISLANSFTTSGNFPVIQTYTGATNVTFPTSGTLATTAQIPSVTPSALTEVNDTNVTLTLGGTPATALLQAVSLTLGWTGLLSGTRGGTGVNNGASTITIGGNVTFSGAFTFAGTLTGTTAVTFPTSGTLATTSQLPSLPLSLANGGTGANLTASNGGIFYSTATAGAILAGTATAGLLLQSGASGAPSWLATANSSILATNGTGVPSWTTTLPAFSMSGNITVGSHNISFASGFGVLDSNNNSMLNFTTTASAVNNFTIINAATGSYPLFRASGSDTTVGLNFQSKGGIFQFSDYTFTNPSSIAIFDKAGSNYVGFASPTTLSTNTTWTLPSADSAGFLQSNGSGVLSFSTAPISNSAKAWGRVTQSAGTYTLQGSFNVASISKTGTGQITINFTTAFADTNYTALASGTDAVNATVRVGTTATGSMPITIINTTGTSANVDSGFSFVCFGV